MILIGLAGVACILALIPALLFHRNLRLYAEPPFPKTENAGAPPAVSVLIPARNEQAAIRAAVEHALASDHVRLEVVVLDDHSEDNTAAIVQGIAARDARVRLVPAPPLPAGWCGKQHACAVGMLGGVYGA
jgi:cellulose synthase/poly-beta-1,6-N-acetylglucosamine synthase-like glycosyltransferase